MSAPVGNNANAPVDAPVNNSDAGGNTLPAKAAVDSEMSAPTSTATGTPVADTKSSAHSVL